MISLLKVLRSLFVEVYGGSWGDPWGGKGQTMVLEVMSNITSPVFSKLIIVLEPMQGSYMSQDTSLLGMLRTIHDIRPFKLVFLLEVSGRV